MVEDEKKGSCKWCGRAVPVGVSFCVSTCNKNSCSGCKEFTYRSNKCFACKRNYAIINRVVKD